MLIKRFHQNIIESRLFSIITIILILCSITIIYFNKINLSIDFTGGTTYQIKYLETNNKISDLNSLIKETNIQIQEFSNNEFIYKIKDNQFKDNNINKLLEILKKDNIKYEIRENNSISANITNEILNEMLIAFSVALLSIFIYVSYRFNIKTSLICIFSLIFDILISMSIISILKIEFSIELISAILLIIGYSLNDSIVLFDSIRRNEIKNTNTNKMLLESLEEILTRTIFTSLTTLLVLISILIFTNKDLFDFSILFISGVIIGTYSSLVINIKLYQLKLN